MEDLFIIYYFTLSGRRERTGFCSQVAVVLPHTLFEGLERSGRCRVATLVLTNLT